MDMTYGPYMLMPMLVPMLVPMPQQRRRPAGSEEAHISRVAEPGFGGGEGTATPD